MHARDLVHRDVKPANLFFVSGQIEAVKLIDFGLVRRSFASRVLTRTGSVLGTPGYIAPEQARGARDVDARADLFSLGCVLFRCLTGRAPFTGDNIVAVLTKVLLEQPPRISELGVDAPPALEALVSAMLEKEPALRPRTALAVAAELGSIAANDLAPNRSERRTASRLVVGLTRSEQRVMALMLVGAGPEGAALPAGASSARGALEESLATLVGARGGQLDRLADGTRLATFTGASAASDLASQAARSALSIRAELPGLPIALATVCTEVAAGLPVGDAIDRAARMLTRGQDGGLSGIAIDDVTAGLLDSRFEVMTIEGGLSLSRVRDDAPLPRTLLGKPTACVGRDMELRVLEQLWERCTEEPASVAVLVTGAAGMGKSRLRYEFLPRARQRTPAMELWIGRGDSLRAGSALALLGDALRGASGIRDGEPLAVRRRKVRERVERCVTLDEKARVAEFLGEIAGAPFPDEASAPLHAARQDARLMSEQLRRAFEDFLRVESSAHPVLLVLEDLHWGDLPTVRFVGDALKNLAAQPFMVLALARPEVHALFPAVWEGRDLSEIRLGPLSRKASERLVMQVLGDAVDDEARVRIAARADGNAFYLEELIRAVAETDRACAGAGTLPETVLAMVQARLEGVPADGRQVLRAGSVFGDVFWRGGIAALLGSALDDRALDAWLGELVARELVSPRVDSRFAGEPELVFRHALLREGAYAMLTEGDCALGHRLAGAWLEEHGERDQMLLAQHFERGNDLPRAARAYRRAAEQALDADDVDAALERAGRAATCGASGEELGALRLVEAEVYNWRGENVLAEQRGVEAIDLCAPGTVAWFRAIHEVAIVAGKLGHFDEVERWSGVASSVLAEDGAMSARAVSLAACATHLILGSRYAAADAVIEVLDRTEGSASSSAKATGMFHQALAFRALAAGNPDGFREQLERALPAFEEAGDGRKACATQTNLGFVFSELGDFERAEGMLRAALPVAERMGITSLSASIRQNLGSVLAYRGAFEEARRFEKEALASFQQQDAPRTEGGSWICLAEIELLAGDVEAAERAARAAIDALTAVPPYRALATAVLARALLRKGLAREALAAAREAFSLLESLGTIEVGEAVVRLVHAEALAHDGHHDDSTRAILSARDRLLERAAKIANPVFRERFLANVPDNARTLALARDASSPGPCRKERGH